MRKEKSEKEVKSKETGRSPVPILDLERQQTPRTWALTLFSIFSVFNMSLSPCPKVCRHPFTRDLAMIPMQHCNAVMLADATAKTRASSHNGLVLLFVAHRDTHCKGHRVPGSGHQVPSKTSPYHLQVLPRVDCRGQGLQRTPKAPKDCGPLHTAARATAYRDLAFFPKKPFDNKVS